MMNQIVMLGINYLSFRFNLGVIYYQILKNYDQAKKCYENVIKYMLRCRSQQHGGRAKGPIHDK